MKMEDTKQFESPLDGAGRAEFDRIVKGMEMNGARVRRVLVIQRADVESRNLAPYLSPLVALLEDRDAVIRRRQDVRPSISGYDSDPRELYQIPEVRTFLALMDQQFPYWFYFVDPDCGFLPILMCCLCPLQSVSVSPDRSTATVAIAGNAPRVFLDRHFGAMNDLFDRFHLDDTNHSLNAQVSKEVVMALRLARVPATGTIR